METNKIQELQFMEQTLQNIIYQKQVFQMEISENLSALNEVEKSKEDVYKVIGQIMIKFSKEDIKKELDEKQKVLDLRLKELDAQEKDLTEKANKLREEVLGNLKKE